MRRYCFALDLKDDPQLIKEYEQHHREVWPEVLESMKSNGIERMEIYRVANRLFMIMEVDENIFDFERCKLAQVGINHLFFYMKRILLYYIY